jgi:glutathione S-transferase
MYQLVGSPVSRAFRVVWAFEELSEPYEIVAVGPHDEKILAVNPSGKVPALLTEGETITDSIAIVQYLADKHGKCTHKAGTLARAHQDSFTQLVADDIDGTLWVSAKHTFVYPEELREKEPVKKAAMWDFARAIKVLEARLGNSTYLTGDLFTVPDLLLCHCAGWAERSGFTIDSPHIETYLARVRERPAYIKASEIREQHR